MRGAIQPKEATMNRKKMLIVVAAVALGIAGAVSSAQAGSKDDDERGGIKIGPLGQMFGGSPIGYAFASAPLTTKHVRGKRASKD
jgi:uncharacterized membrane protein